MRSGPGWRPWPPRRLVDRPSWLWLHRPEGWEMRWRRTSRPTASAAADRRGRQGGPAARGHRGQGASGERGAGGAPRRGEPGPGRARRPRPRPAKAQAAPRSSSGPRRGRGPVGASRRPTGGGEAEAEAAGEPENEGSWPGCASSRRQRRPAGAAALEARRRHGRRRGGAGRRPSRAPADRTPWSRPRRPAPATPAWPPQAREALDGAAEAAACTGRVACRTSPPRWPASEPTEPTVDRGVVESAPRPRPVLRAVRAHARSPAPALRIPRGMHAGSAEADAWLLTEARRPRRGWIQRGQAGLARRGARRSAGAAARPADDLACRYGTRSRSCSTAPTSARSGPAAGAGWRCASRLPTCWPTTSSARWSRLPHRRTHRRRHQRSRRRRGRPGGGGQRRRSHDLLAVARR